MLAKLIALPMASAMASASSQPPVLRIEARVMKNQEDREERDDRELAQRQQPGDADRGHRRRVADDR